MIDRGSWTLPVKKELRQQLRQEVGELSVEAIADKSHKACALLFEQSEFKKAETVMVFLSLPGEMDTSPIVLRCWQERKRVLAPKVSWNQRRMLPVEIRSLTEDLMVTGMGIREPISGIPFPISLLDMVIVPGMGFDGKGNRLGRGRGFYDRFLAHPEFKGIACGLAFEQQVLDDIPTGPLDRGIDMLVTDARVRRFKKT
jgi:5-formyltetrahydrofolate cyclo-ligase